MLDDLGGNETHSVELAAHRQHRVHLGERPRRRHAVHGRKTGFPEGRVRVELLRVLRREPPAPEVPEPLPPDPKRNAIVHLERLRAVPLKVGQADEVGNTIHLRVGIADVHPVELKRLDDSLGEELGKA